MLNAEQSLGKGATQAQIAQARQYAAEKWDTANAIKAEAAAQKLLPEARENASYKQDVEDLKTAWQPRRLTRISTIKLLNVGGKSPGNLAKIRAQQVVTPQQSALEIDPVQQLANQHARNWLSFSSLNAEGPDHQRGLELMNAANTNTSRLVSLRNGKFIATRAPPTSSWLTLDSLQVAQLMPLPV
jgi:hypothetical protein